MKHSNTHVVFLASLLILLFSPAITTAQDSWNLEYLGGLAGHIEDVRIDGEFAFCAVRSGLLVLDISAVDSPVQLALLPLPGVFDIDLKGSYVYLTGCPYSMEPAGGLFVVDISDPGTPICVGYCEEPENPRDLVVDGDYVYVADANHGLRIIDVHDRAAPQQVGFLAADSPLDGLDKSGDMIYLADRYEGLRVIDVSNPALPLQIGLFDPPQYVDTVTISGDTAYVGSYPGLRIVDISVPSLPVELGVFDVGQSVGHIAVEQHIVYLSHSTYVSTIDVTVPSSPVELDMLHLYGRTEALAVVSHTVFVACQWGGLRIGDVTNPAAMTEIGAHETLGTVQNAVIADGTVYITGGHQYSGEFAGPLYKSDPANERLWMDSGLFVVDIATPTVPVQLGFHWFGNATDVAVIGDLAYVTDFLGWFGVMDVSDPAAIELLGTTITPYRAGRLDVEADHALVCTLEHGLRVIDLGEPTNPFEVDDLAIDCTDVVIQDDLAYIASLDFGLRIIDISDPTSVNEVGNLAVDNWSCALVVLDDLVYLANGALGLRIIDVSDVTTPNEVALYDTPGYATSVAADGDYIYVADGDGGLRIIDADGPSSPQEVAYYVTPLPANSVDVIGDNVVVGIGEGGMLVLENEVRTSIDQDDLAPEIPDRNALQQNRPNPFNPRTTLAFELREPALVTLRIFDTSGRLVRTLVTGESVAAGHHESTWDGTDESGRKLAAGVYLYRLETPTYSETRRMTLLK